MQRGCGGFSHGLRISAWDATCHFLVLACGEIGLLASAWEEKARVFVLMDISNEPDDEQSLVRFLVHANEWRQSRLVAYRRASLAITP
jgi:hypothetical protein